MLLLFTAFRFVAFIFMFTFVFLAKRNPQLIQMAITAFTDCSNVQFITSSTLFISAQFLDTGPQGHSTDMFWSVDYFCTAVTLTW